MEIRLINKDVFEESADILVLKHAQGLYGLDRVIANKISEIKPGFEKTGSSKIYTGLTTFD